MERPRFDRAQIDHLAKLAALSLSDGEAERLAHDLGAIVAYVEQLASVDTGGLAAPTVVAATAWREDVVVPGLSHEDALRGAPGATEAGFAVPGFVPAGSTTEKAR
jgi:aspartyl-tRNA(Asn)/glutamyl-tRNA(Gln) amidotransferase subunit C